MSLNQTLVKSMYNIYKQQPLTLIGLLQFTTDATDWNLSFYIALSMYCCYNLIISLIIFWPLQRYLYTQTQVFLSSTLISTR